MSAVATPPPMTPGASSTPPVDAACPLCGAWLDPRQEWCLSCGAAARTRLAAPTNWRAPIVAIAVITVLALGVLAAALVKLSGGSGALKTVSAVTRTVTTPTPIAPGAIPTTTTSATGLGGAVVPTTPGAVSPGTPTTISPSTSTTTHGPTPTATTPTATTPTATTPPNAGTGSSPATEEALRKAGFPPRAKK